MTGFGTEHGPAGRPSGPSIANPRSDRIELRGIRAMGTHGVLTEERARAQPFEVDLDLDVDLAAAGGSDLLADTVDYSRVAEVTRAIVAGPRSFQLIEALAGHVADAVLGVDPKIQWVVVGLRKVRPPLAMDIATVGVRIGRGR